MKGLVLAAVSLAALAGCSTTPNEMREYAPDRTYTSLKAPKKIMFCVADAWEEHATVSTRERPNGYTVAAALSDGKLRYLSDIGPENGTIVTKTYRWRVLPIGPDGMLSAVENCQ